MIGRSALVFSCLLALNAGMVNAQTRSRIMVGWGESILGLNQPPKLPTGVTPSDVDALASGELVNAVALRSGITVGGSPYTGSRFIISGAGGVSGDENGRINYGNGSTPYTDYTSWNEALIARDGSVSLQRVAFGFLHAVVVRTQRQQFVGNDYPGDLAFIGDRLGGYFPAVNTGDGSPMAERYVAVATSATHALALRSTGVVNGFGGINFFGETTVPSGVVGAVGVAAGEYFSAAVLATGQVVVWGSDAFGALQVPAGATNVVSLKAGASHLVALRADGTVLAWGNAADGRTAVPSGLRNVREIAVGRSHTLALREDGTVVAWGYNGSGQTSVPATLSNVIDIAAGGNHSLALVSMERPVVTGISGVLGGTTFNLATDYVERGRTLTLQAGLGNGAPPVQYRWRKNGVLISGATGPSVEVPISAGEPDAFQVDVEAVNAFGNDQRSGTIRVGSGPSDLSVRIGRVGGGSAQNLSPSGVGGIWVPTGGGFTAFGRNSGGVYLTPVDTSSEAIFEVKSRGNPAPVVELWNADTSTLICGPATVPGASTSAQGQQYLKPGIPLATVLANGRFLVVVKSSVGRALTNEVSLSILPAAAAPVITSSLPRVRRIIPSAGLGLTNGLVAYYPFNGNANDESGLQNNGTNVGATPTVDRNGQSGKAFAFNGTGYVSIPHNAGMNFGDLSPMSVSFWMVREPGEAHVIGKRAGQNDCSFQIHSGAFHGSTANWNAGLNYSLPDGPSPWIHMVYTFDGNRMSVYKNGQLEAGQTGRVLGPKSTAPIMIGKLNFGFPFVGSLDDVRFYNRALSDAEIAALYVIEFTGSIGEPTDLLGPVTSGTAGVTLSVDPGYTVPSGSSLQWLREGVEIPGATNSTLTLGAFSYALAKPYALRIRTPLYGTSLAADAAKGQAVSTTLTPVLPVTVGLSKSNISGAAGTKGDIEVSLAGSLTARIRFEKQALNGTWATDASLLGDLTTQAQPPSVNWRGWTDPKEFWANLDGFSGQLKLRVGGTLSSSMRGNYRLVTAQMSHLPQNPNPLEGAAVLDGTEQYSYFTVTVTEPASLSVPTTPPTPVVGGGNWVAGVGNGVDMSLSARAYSTVDLGSYLTTAGTPSPNFQWEKQNSSGQFVSVSGFTNTSRLTVAATPANAGIYRVTATNAVGGAGGVSKLVALSVDRVLVLTNNAMVFPDATVEIPISVVGFGDESAVSFTLDVVSPYLSANVGNIAVALDAALVSSTDLSFRTSGSVDATPVAGGASGAGANRIRVQVQVSRKDPAQRSFPAGTNRLGVLTLKAQTVNNIATIRNVTAPAVAPPLGVPISVLGTLGASDLALRIALTNASLASVVADPGSVMVLADSLEGDVDNNFAVNVVDITTIASVLASGQLGGSYSSPLAASRLDCAPRESSGDRFINLADLVQVARYVAKLDPAQPQADPPGSGSIVLNAPSVRDPRVTRSGLTPSRRIRFGWSDVVAGSAVRIPVVLEGEGDENAMAFNVEFDPAVLVYTGLQTPVGTSQMENAVSAAQGRIGVVLWKGAGKAIPAGGSIVAELEFMVRATGGMTVMRFGPIPVDSMMATVSAKPVLDVTYEPASFTIGSRPRVVGGQIVSHRIQGQIWTVELRLQDSTGATVSAANRRIKLWMADQIEMPEGSWQPFSDQVEVTPAGNLRIPIILRPDRAQQFFRIRED